jgi:predicted dehydrogenase
MSKVYNWGILGCGKIAHKFAQDLSLSKSGVLAACASQSPGKALEFATKYGCSVSFTDYQSLANSHEIDLIYVATPHSHHFEHTMLCLNRQKAVLCEKPLTVNAKYADQLIQTAKEKKCLLMEAMWTAFIPTIEEVKKLISSGEMGDVRHLKADFGFKAEFNAKSRLFDPDLAGGCLLDIGIYPLFMALYLLGEPSELISTAHMAATGVDDECTVLLKYINGASAVLYSGVTTNTDTVCEIFCTGGKITIPSRFHAQSQYIIQKNEQDPVVIQTQKIGHGYFHEIEHMHTCLAKGNIESPIMTFDMSMRLARWMDTIRNQIGVSYKWDI